MTENTKTLLIVGGIAIVAWFAYKRIIGGNQLKPGPTTASGAGQATSPQAGGGDFWSTLGNVGKGLNAGVSAVESTYNNIYDLFGGQPSTSAPPPNSAGSANPTS